MRFMRRNKGSIVLEAALILPIFLSLILLLITFIKISIVEITLTNNVSEVTEEIATHIYPVGLLYYNFSQTDSGEKFEETINKIDTAQEVISETGELIKNYSYLFPNEINELLKIGDKFQAGATEVYDQALSAIFQPLVDYYIDEKVIHLENFHVTKVILPNFIDGNQPYFGIEAVYEMPLNIPFINHTIAIKKTAYERIWMGDAITTNKSTVNPSSPQSGDTSKEENSEEGSEEEQEDEADQIKIQYITSPVQRGKKVLIIATGPENKAATIRLLYPSGFKKSVEAEFNSFGLLVENIKIGGHSNEGSTLVNGDKYKVIVESGGIEDSGTFEVLSKEHMKQYLSNRLNKIN